MSQIGVTGKATYAGVPAATISWTGRSSTSRSGTLVTSARKTPQADVTTTDGQDGERLSSRTRNDRIQCSFTVKPIGSSAADALAIAADLPVVNSICTITCATDSQLASPTGGCSVVDSAEQSYTPEGDAVIDFVVTNWIGKVFVALS